MEIKAIIFDLDGTLINSIEDIADANNRMLEEFAYPVHPLKDYVGWIGNGARTLVEASLPPEKRNRDTLHYLKVYEEFYRENISVKTKLYPNIAKVLDLISEYDIPMAINTNKPQHLTECVVKHYLSNWCFNSVIGHSNHFPHKPNPKGALHFAKQINCPPKNVLFVGDSLVDMQTANAAGMIPLGVSWGYGQPSVGAYGVNMIDQPEELLNYINVKIQI
ncbi:phosphoglycolate phosphatase [Saccharicrinis carchari]|uniref:phosphoglycolate phosphatase n=1 Tax=Saccharicrinis carchari TaxID=1168039 RepID=A0A521DE16_SACCC|nr:HAD family hydrolase [Saccharicrinis carchari]SMO69835.1 phosphoglycolate phosphatase [Saccharicrinis carchari]